MDFVIRHKRVLGVTLLVLTPLRLGMMYLVYGVTGADIFDTLIPIAAGIYILTLKPGQWKKEPPPAKMDTNK